MTKPTKRRLLAALLGTLAAPAAAQDVYLVARQFTQVMPDGVAVPMWGFASDVDGDFTTTGDQEGPSVPGPEIRIAANDPELRIHLKNELSVPVSLIIPGQRGNDNTPTWVTAGGATIVGSRPAGDVTSRVRSFVTETPPGGTHTYHWPDVRPGTYAYRSGTHPQVQIQMGLYGPAIKDAADGEAYPGVAYDHETLLFYSEIDTGLHEAVAGGQYGPGRAVTSTIDYNPDYFLVNGAPYQEGDSPLPAGYRGGRTLLRLVNMGLRTHTMALNNADVALVAEDGNTYPWPRRQYSVMLAAGKSRDALFTPTQAGTFAIYDRMLSLTNRGASPGGMFTLLAVGNSPAPTTTADSYDMEEEGFLSVPAPGVLGNDADPNGLPLTATLVSDTTHGSLVLNGDGSFTYQPTTDFSGTDSFDYRAENGTLQSEDTTVSIRVAAVNDPPVAVSDYYQVSEGDTLTADPGVLANDRDPDGDTLTAVLVTGTTGGQLSLAGDGFTYTPDPGTTSDRFTYVASDGELSSATTEVTIDVVAATNSAPVASDDEAETVMNEPVVIPVVANDTDPDGNIDPAAIVIVAGPNMGGTVANNGDGSVTFTPAYNFRGTDTFAYTVSDTEGAVSNEASVRVDVLRRPRTR